MPELQIVMRGKETALQITFSKNEHEVLFNGMSGFQEIRIEYHGSGAEGFFVTPTDKRTYKESTSVKFLDEGNKKRDKYSRAWINTKFLNLVRETRPKIQTQSKQEGENILFITPIKVHGWFAEGHSATALLEKRQEEITPSTTEPVLEVEEEKPPGPMMASLKRLSQAVEAAPPPPDMGDTQSQEVSFRELLKLVGRCNQLAIRSGEVRFEIDAGRIVVLKVYRQGMVWERR